MPVEVEALNAQMSPVQIQNNQSASAKAPLPMPDPGKVQFFNSLLNGWNIGSALSQQVLASLKSVANPATLLKTQFSWAKGYVQMDAVSKMFAQFSQGLKSLLSMQG